MNILLWIILGGIAGWIASAITSSPGGPIRNIIVGILGAILGGWLMNLLNAPSGNGVSFYSLLVAILGAVVLIWISRAVSK